MENKDYSSGDFINASTNEEFTRLLLANRKRIYGFILSLGHNFSDADDLFQEIALVMCRKFGEFDASKSFSAWGIGIARHRIIKFRQKQHKSKIMFSHEAFEIAMNSSDRMLHSIEDRSKALENCLSKLSRVDRSFVKMRYEQGLKIKDIAELVERPVQGLYKVYARIHASLRQCVSRTLSQWEAV